MCCRAGFVAADLVLAMLVLAYLVSMLIKWAYTILGHGCSGALSRLRAHKLPLLLDCLTCVVLISSEAQVVLCPSSVHCPFLPYMF